MKKKKMHITKYNSWKAPNCYMFRPRCAIFRKSSRTKVYKVKTLMLVDFLRMVIGLWHI